MRRLGVREWLAVGRVMAAGDVTRMGGRHGECARFETRLARMAGTRHALGVTSGTSELVAALQAAGIGPGDEVLVPAYTWMATAAAPLLVGAVPVLVEVDASLAMDPDDMAAKITARTRAVIPVHMLNRPAAMDRILPLARLHDLTVIEDACQAVGIPYKDRVCGGMGDLGALSFNQFKNMTAGEGGAVLTSDPALFARAWNAHDGGIGFRGAAAPEVAAPFVAGNAKLSEIQGAILNVQLSRMPGHLAAIRARLAILRAAFERAGLPIAPHNDPAAQSSGFTTTRSTSSPTGPRCCRGGWRIPRSIRGRPPGAIPRPSATPHPARSSGWRAVAGSCR